MAAEEAVAMLAVTCFCISLIILAAISSSSTTIWKSGSPQALDRGVVVVFVVERVEQNRAELRRVTKCAELRSSAP